MHTIRAWRASDAFDLAAALNNKRIHDHLRDGLPFPYTEEDAADFIQSTLNAPAGTQFSWAIQSDGRAIGSIGIYRKENIHRLTAEIGYYIAEPFWGKGIATRAIAEACRDVFAHTDIVRIFAEPFSGNIGSCRALEKAGFVLEGTLRQNAIKNGTLRDMRMYALIRQPGGAHQ